MTFPQILDLLFVVSISVDLDYRIVSNYFTPFSGVKYQTNGWELSVKEF